MRAQGERTDLSVEIALDNIPENEEQARETQGVDPLLALAGTLECEVTDIGERHDDYIGDALLAELRGDNDESDFGDTSLRNVSQNRIGEHYGNPKKET